MKKKIFLLFLMLLLTGCTVNYDITIKDNVVEEKITGTVENSELDNLNDDRTDTNIFQYNMYSRRPLEDETSEYHKKVVDHDTYKEFEYTYKYNNNYIYSNTLNICFDNRVLDETEDYYYISLKSPFNCLFQDEIVVNVKTDYAVIENNADKVKDNTYTWIIDNQDNVDIQMVISKKISHENNKYKFKITHFQIICFIVLIVLSLIAYLLCKKVSQNKI